MKTMPGLERPRLEPSLEPSLELMVNGDVLQVPDGTDVAALLDRLQLDRRKVAVERNEEIVPRSVYAATQLETGDRLEIVHFIGGG